MSVVVITNPTTEKSRESTNKPERRQKLIIDALTAAGIVSTENRFPASWTDLERVHHREYLEFLQTAYSTLVAKDENFFRLEDKSLVPAYFTHRRPSRHLPAYAKTIYYARDTLTRVLVNQLKTHCYVPRLSNLK